MVDAAVVVVVAVVVVAVVWLCQQCLSAEVCVSRVLLSPASPVSAISLELTRFLLLLHCRCSPSVNHTNISLAQVTSDL